MVERARLVSLRRLGAALVSRRALQAALTGVATLLAGPAMALDYCDAQQPCLQSGVSCYYSVCVPDSAICTADSQCDGWETCDMTCQGLPGGTSSSGGSTEPMPIPGADAGSSGGGSGSGEMPSPKVDAGSGFAPPPDGADANAAIPQPDWDGSGSDGGWTAPSCPTDKGICKPKAEKIPIQEVCIDFCAVMLPCENQQGGGTDPGDPIDPPPMPGADAGSSGGSSGSGGAPMPPPEFDAGSSDKMAPPDGGAAMDGGANDPMPDGGGIMEPPGPDETMQCQTICSLVVLEKIAAPQFQGLTKCIADNAKETCEAIEAHCTANQEAFENALSANDEFVLELLGMSMGGSGGPKPTDPGTDVSTGEDTTIFVDGGSTGGTDQTGPDGVIAADGNESQTDGSGKPQEPDGAAPLGDTMGADGVANADASTTPGGTSSKKSDSGGCTAGATSSQSSTGLAGLLGLFATVLVSRRRLQRVAVKR